jgi:hypothetical protein
VNPEEISNEINNLTTDEVSALNISLETKKILLETRVLELKTELAAKKLKYWWVPTSDYMLPIIIGLLLLVAFIG